MRKNKRRKKRLKTALILLIILFILAGFGGMLFVSHKNKIEKEQRKEAALAPFFRLLNRRIIREPGIVKMD